MAFERIGLGAVLSFDGSKFSAGIKKPRDELGRFLKTGKQTTTMVGRFKLIGTAAFKAVGRSMMVMRAGMASLKSGMLGVSLAFAPLTLGALGAAGKFATFEQQMQNVKAVAGFTTEQFVAMEKKSKQLGATTAFSATQAGEGFEELARAGFSFEDQMGAIGGVLNLAAADAIELSVAAGITSNVLNAMGINANEASRVADVLAQTSANAATDVTQLGEAFKFAAPIASTMGIELEDTALALGLISNAGIKGTSAGNSFKNMLLKLAKPTAKGTKLMTDYGIQVFETAEGNLDLKKTMDSVIAGTKGITSATKRAAVMSEIFGLRGQGAVAALDKSIQNGKFDKLRAALDDATGAAERMAKTRLDSFLGQITLLSSAAEGFAIEFFEPFVSMAKDALEGQVIPFISGVVSVMQALASEGASVDDLKKKFGLAAQVAMGIKDAISAILGAIATMKAKMTEWMDIANEAFGGDTARKVAKFATLFLLIGAAAAPVIIAIIAIGFAVSSIASIIIGLGSILAGAFLPVLIIGGGIAATLAAISNENETLGQTATRAWGSFKAVAMDTWQTVLKPMFGGMKEAGVIVLPELQRIWTQSFGIMKAAVLDLFQALFGSFSETDISWRDVGQMMVFVLSSIIEAVIKLTTFIVIMVVQAVKLFKAFAKGVIEWMIMPFTRTWNLLKDIGKGFKLIFQGNIVAGLKQFGKALLNFILAPLRMIIRNIVRLADAIPGLGKTIPEALRNFANVGAVGGLAVKGTGTKGPSGKRGAPAFLGAKKPKAVEVTKKSASVAAEGAQTAGEVAAGLLETSSASQTDAVLAKLDEVKGAAGKSPCIDNNVSVAIDNETVARGQARHKAELGQRSGFKATPWQRRTAVEFGSAPTRGGGVGA